MTLHSRSLLRQPN